MVGGYPATLPINIANCYKCGRLSVKEGIKMKRIKLFMTLLVAAVTIAGVDSVLLRSVYADSVTVIIDGRFITFGDVPAQIVNDRTMVPVRALADELGAHTEWNDDTQSVLLTLGTRYATLRIGSPIMLYGEFTRSEAGDLSATSTETLHLDSPPIILEERSLFPLSAIVTAFGVEFEWVAANRTVIINTQGSNQAEPEIPILDDGALGNLPIVSPPSVGHVAFAAESGVFLPISGSHAQTLRNSSQQFAMVVFDSQDQNSVRDVPMLASAARAAGYQLFGVDIRPSDRFRNPDALTWLWEETHRGSYPILVFSYRDGQHQIFREFPSHVELVGMFENIMRDFPVLPNADSTAQQNTDDNATNNTTASTPQATQFVWGSMTYQQSQQRFNNNESFIAFFFETGDYDLVRVRDMVHRLGQNHRVPVYYINMSTATEVSGSRWTHNFGGMRTPSLFIVRNSNHVMSTMDLRLSHERQLNSMFVSFRQHLEQQAAQNSN